MSRPHLSNVLLVDQTYFYNKTQDVAVSKSIFDVRSRTHYDDSHIRASFSLGIEESEMIQTLLELVNGKERVDENLITIKLNTLFGKNSMFKLRGLSYKTILLYGDEINIFGNHEDSVECNQAPLETPVEKFTNEIHPNCELFLPSSLKISTPIHWNDMQRYTILLLSELLRREGKLDNIIVLTSYKSFCEKYGFLLTLRETGIGYQGIYPSEIIENFLYLGDKESASSDVELTDLGITYILNMAEEVSNDLELLEIAPGVKKYSYLKLGTGDTISHSISNLFEQANEFLREAYEKKCKAIVNCNMGVSRSSTTVISYIMKYYGLSFEQVFHHVKNQRSVTCPNAAFREQLKSFYNSQ
ncbi:hypothetical protein C9374_008726 [Naegleria lovaniensis]|uniref:protein-tyrosine-phosphatase n=1 Tax=Naegleria lovaniensis TaxID=51637 RepID=A0AA88KKR6_NAELO|nr:uncharacterized protein C9374_008726 [Naegleria lovaniensis]KAG2378104.1 hypothetical protein C9374_008726 [Naegleria lovaniensis]